MKAEEGPGKNREVRNQLKWLGVLCLSLGILLRGVSPLWQKAYAEREQVALLAAETERLQQFAFHWDGEIVQEEKEKLQQQARFLEQTDENRLLQELEQTAERCQVRCLQLLPLSRKVKSRDNPCLDVTLEGDYPRLLTFFRQWEEAHPGSWTENAVLETAPLEGKINYNGKFYTAIKKSSKSG